MRGEDDLRGELRLLVSALRRHVAGEQDAYLPVSRLRIRRPGCMRAERSATAAPADSAERTVLTKGPPDLLAGC